ncbi:MAG: hypothetical protein QM308_06615 [Bacillota bacterium]|nr:hypothetical protein [Bacillota bacterium]
MKPGGFADLHQHVLWGLDDGPGTAEQMHALLEQNAAEGICLVYATSHADPQRRPFDLTLYQERLEEARVYCEKKGLDLRILPGSEIRYRGSVPDRLAAGNLLPLGASRHVLIEFDPDVSLFEIQEAADSLYRAGYLPVLAHVERYRCLRHFPQKAMDLREEYGMLFQMNCDAITHLRNLMERRFVRRMLTAQAIDVIATDAHDAVRYPAQMREAYRTVAQLYGEDYAKHLTEFGWRLLRAEEGQQA